ncbi:MAG: tRNA pseudouridine(13) synthase TruD [Myxococcota bacterium]
MSLPASQWRCEEPDDFQVEELPLYAPAGEGGHTFVRIEKRLRTTEEVVRDLARAAGVRSAEVGYAGRKDRMAIATQWLSVPGLDPSDALAISLPGVRILEAALHPHKLRTGQLRANRFSCLLRDLEDARCDLARARLGDAEERGLPNRFGAQRFGRNGDNVQRGLGLLREGRVSGGRRAARFLVSALQAAVFNDVLEARAQPLEVVESGDVAQRHDSGGLFVVTDAAQEAPRARAFEISATGPIFGHKVISPEGLPADLERRVLAGYGIDPDALPRLPGVRLRGSRRAFRVRPEGAQVQREGPHLRVDFTLLPGCYATLVLEALLDAGLPGGGE